MKTLLMIVSLLVASPALATECRDALTLPTGETFCADTANTKGHLACKTDPVMCPGPILDPCLAPGADPNGAACSAAKAKMADHTAILAQCYSPAGRRTDVDAKSKCSKIWR
jgi:hypothetical protein